MVKQHNSYRLRVNYTNFMAATNTLPPQKKNMEFLRISRPTVAEVGPTHGYARGMAAVVSV